MDLSESFVRLFATHPIGTLYANATAHTDSICLDGHHYPLTIVDRLVPNCYTIAPHAAIVSYAKDETVKLPRTQALPIHASLTAVSGFLRLCDIDKVVGFDNYGLSTNTLGSHALMLSPTYIRDALHERYPEHAYLIRSLNRHHHADFIDKLTRAGWQLITSRQVYVYDDIDNIMHHRNVQRDFALLDDGQFVFAPASSPSDYEQAVHWYNRLYLDKYSIQNVQFTPTALTAMHALGIIKLWLLIDTHSGKSVGVTGVVSGDDIVTAPVVGYDLDRCRTLGLYRRVIAKAMHSAQQQQMPLNLSSGAPDFKTNRGAKPVIEYTAVYHRHLSVRRQAPWRALHKVSPHYAALLINHKL